MLKFEKIHEDKRGEIYVITDAFAEGREITLFTTKKGYARGGCIHKDSDEWCCVLDGKIVYVIKSEKNLVWMDKGDTAFVPKNTPHYFVALTPTIVMEWGPTPAEKKVKDREYRSVVENINKIQNDRHQTS